jgi:glycosyltransferase involved in cell wall biosynthesis
LFAYREARLLTSRLESIGRPLKLGLMLRVLSRGGCFIEDESGRQRPLSIALLLRWCSESLIEPFSKGRFLRAVAREIKQLESALPQRRPVLRLEHQPVYVRADLAIGLKAGGSVGHIAGVVNHLRSFGGKPLMLTTDQIPTVDPGIETRLVTALEAYWEYPELPSLVMNEAFKRVAKAELPGRTLSFVYQRYAVNSWAGAWIALRHNLPFVLEYNGSEVWISRNWGQPLEHEALSLQIEDFNLRAADLIVVVSQPMADELVRRNVPSEKILVNPNGVEPDRYSPAIAGEATRSALGLDGKLVFGFIGTFGAWHGAEVLAEAFARLMARYPHYRDQVRLLMVGDGIRMPQVRDALTRGGVLDLSVLPGVVPQADGPRYLAACDILASPHVPNADGSPFFGSPTKLFEYMAMGKGIVASDLDQIGEILEHGRAARMTVPGDVDSLVEGLRDLIENPGERARLGAEARRLAVERHTWREHTHKIVSALRSRVPTA